MKTKPSDSFRPVAHFFGMTMIVIFWVSFCLGWARVMQDESYADLRLRLAWLGGSALAYGLAMVLWVWHCRRTARKPHSFNAGSVHDRDHLGRPVVVESPATTEAKHLIVQIMDGVKLYRLAELPALDEAAEQEVSIS
jgi:hypothetical protein